MLASLRARLLRLLLPGPGPRPADAPSTTSSSHAHLHLEQLEQRNLLSGNPAVVPTPGAGSVGVLQYETAIEPKGDPSIVFLGDSITYGYAHGLGAYLWQQQLAPRGALDLGVNGQTTANLLYQVDTGLLNGLHPNTIVLMIGTNNLLGWNQAPEPTAEGIIADITAIHAVQPSAQIVVLGVLPNSYNSLGTVEGTNFLVNVTLPRLPFASQVHFYDMDSLFEKNGTANPLLYFEGVHPNILGYSVETSYLVPILDTLTLQSQQVPTTQPTFSASPAPSSIRLLIGMESIYLNYSGYDPSIYGAPSSNPNRNLHF